MAMSRRDFFLLPPGYRIMGHPSIPAVLSRPLELARGLLGGTCMLERACRTYVRPSIRTYIHVFVFFRPSEGGLVQLVTAIRPIWFDLITDSCGDFADGQFYGDGDLHVQPFLNEYVPQH